MPAIWHCWLRSTRNRETHSGGCADKVCQHLATNAGGECAEKPSFCTKKVCDDIYCVTEPDNEGAECATTSSPCTKAVCETGSCVTRPDNEGGGCDDDGNECTDDICEDGACTHPPKTGGTSCTADTNECTDDICQNGSCGHPAKPDETSCTADETVCTRDVCLSGACSHPATNNNEPCETDNDACTDDLCQNGSCNHFFECSARLGGSCCPAGQTCCNGTQCCDVDKCCGNGQCCSQACEGCIDNGSLVGGTITVNPDPVCIGDTITYIISGVTDNGGIERVFCTAKQAIAPGGVTYTWTITKPGGAQVTGVGAVATVVADLPGTYSVTFMASPTRTTCPPTDITVGPTTGTAIGADLDVDSDNNNGTGPPDGSPAEDAVELTAPGKILCVNDDDDDGDGVPDKDQEPPPVSDNDLVQMVAQIAPNAPVGSKWKLEYDSFVVQVYESDRTTIVPRGQVFNMALDPNPKNFWIEAIAATNAPGKIVLHVDSDGDGTFDCSDAVLVTTSLCAPIITAHVIDQDDPTSEAWTEVAENTPVYGGSEASTADNLKFTLAPPLPDTVSDITWTVEGTGSASFLPPPTGPDAVEWDVGDLLDPVPGPVVFAVSIRYDDGTKKCVEFKTEIGVRTDDVIVIGWIDSNAVPLSTAGVNAAFILPTFTPTGSSSTFLCGQFISLLTQGDVQPNDISLLGAANLDREYLLNWLFKFGGNTDPLITIPGDFRDPTDHHMDENKFTAFVEALTTYKLINRYQVKYLVDGTTFKAAPERLKRLAAIGWTIEPCGSGVALLGQGGAKNGLIDSNPGSIWHVNDGSPDAAGIQAFNTLMGNAVPTNPLFWENIGSRIRFRANGGTEPEIDVQVFPTYSVYHNGKLVDTHTQAPSPMDVFTLFPYPFGAVPCTTIPFPHAQGRCGFAGPPVESSAGDTPYWP